MSHSNGLPWPVVVVITAAVFAGLVALSYAMRAMRRPPRQPVASPAPMRGPSPALPQPCETEPYADGAVTFGTTEDPTGRNYP